MSVIFGIKENNRIIIAGDKRGSSIDGKTLSDDLDKVLMINDHLAFSSAGNAAIEKAISIDLNKATNKKNGVLVGNFVMLRWLFYPSRPVSSLEGFLMCWSDNTVLLILSSSYLHTVR